MCSGLFLYIRITTKESRPSQECKDDAQLFNAKDSVMENPHLGSAKDTEISGGTPAGRAIRRGSMRLRALPERQSVTIEGKLHKDENS
jgi:hypothetical protein